MISTKKIHTIIGEDPISNLIYNTEKVNYKNYTQMLLQIYTRNSKGEINIDENIRNHHLDGFLILNSSNNELLSEVSSTKKD